MDEEVRLSSKWRRERAHAPDASTPFSPGDCSVLVLYAVKAFDDEPSSATPRFVVGTLPKLGRPLADGAPNLMEMTREDLAAGLQGAATDAACDAETRAALREAMRWIDGHEIFLIQLEPPAIAELGVARERGFAWEREASEQRKRKERTPLIEYAEAPVERLDALARELGVQASHRALLAHHEALRGGAGGRGAADDADEARGGAGGAAALRRKRESLVRPRRDWRGDRWGFRRGKLKSVVRPLLADFVD